ncbi:MAG: hypothetical protein J6X30_04695 [Clostridia bacterium]|nr:hypothetical protein [Clostridia bacterium]
MRTFFMILISAVMVVFHLMLAPALAIAGMKIDFFMISVVMLALFTKKWYPPVLCALYSGIAVDLTTQAGTFINTGIYVFIAVTAFFVFFLLKENNFLFAALAVLAFTASKHLIFVLLLYVMRLSQTATLATFLHGLPAAIYTAAAGSGLYFVYRLLFRAFFMQEKNEEESKFLLS